MKKKKVKPSPKSKTKKKTVMTIKKKKSPSKAAANRTKKKSKKVQSKKTASKKPVARKTPAKAVQKTPRSMKKKKTVSKKGTPKKTIKKTATKAKSIGRKNKPAATRAVPKKKHVTKKTKTGLKKKPLVRTPRVAEKIRDTEEERRFALRKVLVEKRRAILQEAKTEISKYIKGETRQLVDTALDDGDWSVVDLSEDINLRQLGSHRENLQRIDEALRKLNEGTYGICEDCGDEISSERLRVLPFAIYCVDCQERKEKIEEMERKHGIM